MSKPTIAFLGLGIMGSGMARRLLGTGFPLHVFNRKRERAEALAKDGAHLAASPREAAAPAEIVISMLADDQAARSVWLGEDGALAGVKKGSLLIESSTVTVAWIKELTAAAQARGCQLLDAPVTGTKPHAAAGELNFLVGGAAEALERARPALTVMSRSITHLGPTGSGALIKLINNFVCGVQAAAFAEAVGIIERSDMDQAKAIEVLTQGAPGSPLMKMLAPRIAERDYTPNFRLQLMAKDLTYAAEEGRNHSQELATAIAALRHFQSAMVQGHGDQDFSAVVELFRPTT